jgi:phosphoglycolate phosphatase-like HAD superfamily hydrolase
MTSVFTGYHSREQLMKKPVIYALDFDGVICDSAIETGITGWKAAIQIWPDMKDPLPSTVLINQFRLTRPIIETGFEAILIIRLLYLDQSIDSIINNFKTLKQQALVETNQTPEALKKLFGNVRDHWIKNNLGEWVAMNPLFPGIRAKLKNLGLQPWTIITTKQERFVAQILAANEIDLPSDNIYGLDRQMSKEAVLSELLEKNPQQNIHFVEDRLPTLLNVIANDRLSTLTLSFALWGYNTTEDKSVAKSQQRINSITLDHFL